MASSTGRPPLAQRYASSKQAALGKRYAEGNTVKQETSTSFLAGASSCGAEVVVRAVSTSKNSKNPFR
jgi:hypothetical protein